MLYFLLILSLLFLFHSSNLLLSLLILEILSFLVMFYLAYFISSDLMIMIFFSVFVMEGVMALSGLIMLVSFTGSDYVSSSSLLKF